MADNTFSQAATEILPNEIWFLIFDEISIPNKCTILPKYYSDDWRFAWVYPFLILTSKQLKNIASQYVESNRLYRTHIPYIDFTAFMALQGSLSCVKYLLNRQYPCTLKTTACAAYQGSLDLLKFLHDEVKCKWHKQTCEMAAMNGNLSALQYVHSIGCQWTAVTCAAAATNSLACLKYAHDNGCQWDGSTCSSAAENNRLDCLTYAYDRGCPWDSKTVQNAASKNSFSCFKFAIKNGCAIDTFTYDAAAMSGSIQCLQYLLDNYPHKPDVGLPIVVKDNIDIIKFAHEKGMVTWKAVVCEAASKFGSINALKYAREHKCPWTAKTANNAANLACLQYALQNGCPYTPAEVCANAVTRGDLAMLKYAVEFGCEWDLNTLCKGAIVNDMNMVQYIYNRSQPEWPKGLKSTDREVLTYMHEHQCPWDSKQTEVLAELGYYELLQYVHERGCEWGRATCDLAAKGGYFNCLKYAREKGAPCGHSTLLAATCHDEQHCIKYIREQNEGQKSQYYDSAAAVYSASKRTNLANKFIYK
jgi:hypothetical protein